MGNICILCGYVCIVKVIQSVPCSSYLQRGSNDCRGLERITSSELKAYFLLGVANGYSRGEI